MLSFVWMVDWSSVDHLFIWWITVPPSEHPIFSLSNSFYSLQKNFNCTVWYPVSFFLIVQHISSYNMMSFLLMILFFIMLKTEHCVWMDSILAPCLESPGLKCWPGDHLFWVRFVTVFLSFFRHIPKWHFRLGQTAFFDILSNLLFTVHNIV
jgi:hypothetical protein